MAVIGKINNYYFAIQIKMSNFAFPMRHSFLTILMFCLGCFGSLAHDIGGSEPRSGRRVGFTENKGQWPAEAQMRALTDRAVIWLEADRFTIEARRVFQDSLPLSPLDQILIDRSHAFNHFMPTKSHVYRMVFEGISPDARLKKVGKMDGYENFYLGSDSTRWASGCRSYATAEYQGLYDGIDLYVRSSTDAIKYEYRLAPGADPQAIRIRYDGADWLKIDRQRLLIGTSVGEIAEERPYAYQIVDRDTVEIEAAYHLDGDVLSFSIGDYDPKSELVIDPLIFSTYTGSAADNWGTTAAFDSYKNAYTAGIVFGAGYPVSLGAFDNAFHNNADVGIFKFDTTGSSRLYATYLGGCWADMPHSMFVNSMDELVIFGTTGSNDFPTTENAYDRSFNGGSPIGYLCLLNHEAYRNIWYPDGSDLFVCRFNADGTRLQASTYLGGSENDGLNYRTRYNNTVSTTMNGNDSLYYNYGDGARGEIITDDLSNVYIGTTTMSLNFPTTFHSVQRISQGQQEGVVVKIDYNLSNLLWSTYLGGEGDDAVYSVDVDRDYNLMVCGGTTSHYFPTLSNGLHPQYLGGTADGFVAKISYAGDRLMGSTLYGSNTYDQCYFVRCGKDDDVYIFGQTKAYGSSLIHNATYSVPNSGQFLARMSPTLDSLRWSTVFGTGNGQPNISPTAFGADICDRVYAVGWGRDFVGYNGIQWNTSGTTDMEVTPDAFQSRTDGQDFYLMSLSADASHLDYASFFGEIHASDDDGGGDHVDGGTSRFDKLGTLYQSVCASCGGHDGFPTTEGVWSDQNQSSNCNNALFRFNIHNDFAVAEFAQPAVGCVPYTVMLENTGRGTSWLWDFGDGATSDEFEPVHTYSSAGEYTIRLIAYLDDGCTATDTMERKVMVLNNTSRTISPTLSCNGDPVQIGYPPMMGCSYRWLTDNVTDNSISNPWVYEDGDYVLYMSSPSGCVETDTFRVHFIQLIDTLIIRTPTCPGYDNGQVVVVPSDYTPGTIYTWDGTATTDSVLSGLSASPMIHNVVVENDQCRSSQTFVISDPEPMVLSKEAGTFLCTDSCYGWIHLTSYCIDTLRQGLCPGTYTTEVRDTNGCLSIDTTTIILDHQLDAMSVWADDTTIFLTTSTVLHTRELPEATYSWTPSETLESPESPNTLSTPEDTVTTYHVAVTDNMGCSWDGDITIHCTEVVCGEPNIFIPNAFTPNDDGHNDRLCFRGEYLIDFHFALYTRWGEKVFETHNVDDCWDGRYKGEPCMPGVYTYTCQITCEAGFSTSFKGNVTLIR